MDVIWNLKVCQLKLPSYNLRRNKGQFKEEKKGNFEKNPPWGNIKRGYPLFRGLKSHVPLGG